MIKSALQLGFEEGQRHHEHFVVAVPSSGHQAMTLEDALDLQGHLGACEVLILPHPDEEAAKATAKLIKKHGVERVKWT